jgi:hypothetical protein
VLENRALSRTLSSKTEEVTGRLGGGGGLHEELHNLHSSPTRTRIKNARSGECSTYERQMYAEFFAENLKTDLVVESH